MLLVKVTFTLSGPSSLTFVAKPVFGATLIKSTVPAPTRTVTVPPMSSYTLVWDAMVVVVVVLVVVLVVVDGGGAAVVVVVVGGVVPLGTLVDVFCASVVVGVEVVLVGVDDVVTLGVSVVVVVTTGLLVVEDVVSE
ncbi:hypothetical protein MNBD_ACTINO02-2615, partial [hydrothermal vent metagenome]